MSCPDINLLIDFLAGRGLEAGVEAHLAECPSCQADLQFLKDIRVAVLPEIEVPDILVQQVLDATVPLDAPPQIPRMPLFQWVVAVLLGVFTTFGTFIATGTGGGGSALPLLLIPLGVGLGAGLLQRWVVRNPGLL